MVIDFRVCLLYAQWNSVVLGGDFQVWMRISPTCIYLIDCNGGHFHIVITFPACFRKFFGLSDVAFPASSLSSPYIPIPPTIS